MGHKSPTHHPMMVRVPLASYDWLRARAEELERPVNWVVAKILDEAVKKALAATPTKTAPPSGWDAQDAQRRREEVDAIARRSFIKQMEGGSRQSQP